MRVEQGAYATELLHSPRLDELSPADRALCTEIVMGVERWRSRLDHAIADLSSQPLGKLDVEVLVSLRIGAYQLGFLERVPARAAVNESVELVKRARKRSAAAMVNAVLRKLEDRRADQKADLTSLQYTSPQQLARALAHPEWLVERWASEYGIDTAARICAYNQQPPPTSIRLRASTPDEIREVESDLERGHVKLAPGALLHSARRVLAGDVSKTKALAQKRVYIQDESSQLVALLVRRGERVLDCCAAPGGKTAAIADRNPQADIVAVDLHPHRANLLRSIAERKNVKIIAADARALPIAGNFDRILADVPCSGTGTLARNPEIKWRLKAEDLAELQQRQLAILLSGCERLSPGGTLVYSTCSLEREECEAVVEQALQARTDVKLRSCRDELQRLRDTGELAWKDIDGLIRDEFLRTLPGVHPGDG